VNVDQLKLALGQSDDALGMVQQWLEQLHHLADHGHMVDASAAMAQATVLLGEVRAKLDATIEALDGGSGEGVSVELV
jgi:hypothetical protein